MANPEVSKLIQELSTILERNRQQRQTTEATMLGQQQGFQAAQQQKLAQQQLQPGAQSGEEDDGKAKPGGAAAGAVKSGIAALGKLAGGGSDDTAQAVSFANSSSGYGGDHGNAMGLSSTQASAKTLSPSTSREGRMGIASKYIEAQGGPSQRESQLLSKNPYTGSGYEFLPENAAPPSMTPDPALEEQKKRFTQNLMLSRGQTGGPMGGAGQPPPPGDGLDPSVVNAVSRSGGGGVRMPMPNMGGAQSPAGAAPMPNAGPPQGWSQQDYDLLGALSERYPGG